MRSMRVTLAALCLAAAPAALAAVPVSQEQVEAQRAEAAEIDAFVAAMKDQYFRPGEFVRDWNAGGIDIYQELERAGGADDHYFLMEGGDGPGVTIVTDEPISRFSPQGWMLIRAYETETPLDRPEISFFPLEPGYIAAVRGGMRSQGGAFCTKGMSDAALYRDPDQAPGENDSLLPILFSALVKSVADMEICVRYEEQAPGRFTGRSFLPDGRSLPTLDDSGDVTTIVPAAPVEELLGLD